MMSSRSELRESTLVAARAAIAAVTPIRCIERTVQVENDRLIIGPHSVDLSSIARILVVGMGKASAAMAQSLEALLGSRISGGLVLVPEGYSLTTSFIEIREGGHPVPDHRSIEETQHLLKIVDSAGKNDLLLCLISGGGSALLTLPVPSVSLDDLAETTNLLLKAGVPIQKMNALRKHLSQVKGGRLAARAHPAQVVSLILSDVPGDQLDAIASGPTAPDPTTFHEARQIAYHALIWDRLPESVRRVILAGIRGETNETLKPGDSRFSRVSNVIIGSGRIAGEAARAYGEKQGFQSILLTSTLQGEARIVGGVLASIGREFLLHGTAIRPPALLIAAGETTVTITGCGVGGRNQELVLAAAAEIDGLDGIVVCSVGTDGRDGPTDAAGGIVDGGTVMCLSKVGIQVSTALATNSSYEALRKSGDLVVTGPTMTNVADIAMIALW